MARPHIRATSLVLAVRAGILVNRLNVCCSVLCILQAAFTKPACLAGLVNLVVDVLGCDSNLDVIAFFESDLISMLIG